MAAVRAGGTTRTSPDSFDGVGNLPGFDFTRHLNIGARSTTYSSPSVSLTTCCSFIHSGVRSPVRRQMACVFAIRMFAFFGNKKKTQRD
jgi:hypothetical protein